MEWHGIIIETTEEAVDMIAGSLYEIGVKGIEIVDHHLTQEERDSLIVDYIDEAIEDNSSVLIKCYFSAEENINEKLTSIRHALDEIASYMNIGSGKIEVILTKEEDWANNWKQYYKPFRIGDNILIKPTWETVTDLRPEDILIEIDPGMAFGSGTHETTSLCTKSLQKYLKQGDRLIDVGCGSGILSIVGAKLGAEKVEAVDIDAAAVKVAKENIEINGLKDKIRVFTGDLLDQIHDKADVVVANIMADIIILLVDDIKRVMKPEGLFISSGIIEPKKPEVLEKILSAGFEVVEVNNDKDWVAITARLKA